VEEEERELREGAKGSGSACEGRRKTGARTGPSGAIAEIQFWIRCYCARISAHHPEPFYGGAVLTFLDSDFGTGTIYCRSPLVKMGSVWICLKKNGRRETEGRGILSTLAVLFCCICPTSQRSIGDVRSPRGEEERDLSELIVRGNLSPRHKFFFEVLIEGILFFYPRNNKLWAGTVRNVPVGTSGVFPGDTAGALDTVGNRYARFVVGTVCASVRDLLYLFGGGHRVNVKDPCGPDVGLFPRGFFWSPPFDDTNHDSLFYRQMATGQRDDTVEYPSIWSRWLLKSVM